HAERHEPARACVVDPLAEGIALQRGGGAATIHHHQSDSSGERSGGAANGGPLAAAAPGAGCLRVGPVIVGRAACEPGAGRLLDDLDAVDAVGGVVAGEEVGEAAELLFAGLGGLEVDDAAAERLAGLEAEDGADDGGAAVDLVDADHGDAGGAGLL